MSHKAGRILVFIPTYNEVENVEKICSEIIALGLDFDLLFLDDNSPDGTGALLDGLAARYKNVLVIHRPNKLGIGSAHLYGLKRAYDMGYEFLITMDGDYAHSPEYLRMLIGWSGKADVIVGSRYIMKNSLAGWNLLRKFLTLTGHFFTKYLLGIKYDATGAFRLYNLGTVPREAFDLVESSGYSFFFESLYVLNVNGFKIDEMPIILPSRIYGHSKMNVWEVFRSLKFLTRIYTRALFNRNRYLLKSASERHLVRGASNDSPCWDAYWESKDGAGGTLYDNIASFYRRFVIQANLRHFIGKNFNKGSSLLHAGCGGGQVDGKINREFVITAVDNSSSALAAYRRFNACVHSIVRADIRGLPFKNASFDGVYNLGVMEHFAEEEILRILTEFRRVLRPGGKLVIFWPPSFGASVVFLKLVRFFLSGIFKRKVVLHPEEPMLLRSKKQARGIFIKAGFRVVKEYFGPRDLFTQVVIVAEKVE